MTGVGTILRCSLAVLFALAASAGGAAAPAFAPAAEKTGGMAVQAVYFSGDDPTGERICIVLDGDEVPVMGVLEGERPRIFMDFLEVAVWEGPKQQRVDGRFVRSIRAHLHRDVGRLRIVLDMAPGIRLFVAQRYFTMEHIFCLWISDRPLEEPSGEDGTYRLPEPR